MAYPDFLTQSPQGPQRRVSLLQKRWPFFVISVAPCETSPLVFSSAVRKSFLFAFLASSARGIQNKSLVFSTDKR
jgi:hypothetical protein